MLALSPEAFDRDDGSSGWRTLSDAPDCERAIAELIRAYRLSQPEGETIRSLLYANEGFKFARSGEFEQAIEALLASKLPDDEAWNAYVDATVAFLKRDREALLAARERLAAVPPPPGFDEAVAAYKAQSGIERKWPFNLEIVDGLIACYEKPFWDAYNAPGCVKA
jgi:hypothetical protein